MKDYLNYQSKWRNNAIYFRWTHSSGEIGYYDCYNSISGFIKKEGVKKAHLIWV